MVLVCVPLKKEWHYLFELFVSSGWDFKKAQVRGFWFWFFPEKEIVVVRVGCGPVLSERQTGFALQCLQNSKLYRSFLKTQGFMEEKKPEKPNQISTNFPEKNVVLKKIQTAFCIGSGGSLSRKVSPGDLVCGTRMIDYPLDQPFLDSGKNSSSLSFESYEPPVEAVETLRLKSKNHPIHFGPIASVGREVVRAEQRDQIFKSTGALAVAQEGMGSVRASQTHNLSLIEIRAITDWAWEGSYLEFQRNFKKSMESLGLLMMDLFDKKRE